MKKHSLLINILGFLFLLFVLGIFFSNALMQIATTLYLPFIIYLVIKKINERKLTLVELLIILLFFSSILSIFISPDPTLAVKNIIYYSILIVIIPITYLVDHDEIMNIQLVGKLIASFALLSAGLGIIRYLSGAERAYGFFGGYYTLASTLAFALPITFAFIFYTKDLWKYISVISTIVQSLALWFTFTRSAILGLLIGGIVAVVILFFNSEVAKPVRIKIASSSVFAMVIILFLLFTSSDTRLNPILLLSNPDISSGRNEIYNDAYNTITTDLNAEWKNIIWGHGLESRIIIFPNSNYTSWESDYVETLISQGLLGLLLVILIYYQFFKLLFRILSKVNHTKYYQFLLGLTVSGIAFWIISFFSSQLVGRNSSAYFVVVYSLMIYIDKVYQKEKADSLPN